MSSVPFYAKRFISGITFNEALTTIQELNSKQISVTVDVLGENITKLEQTQKYTQEYISVINKIKAENLDCYVSIKLTMLGLDIDETICYENLSKILNLADQNQCRVALDMEGTKYTEKTIAMYERSAKEFKSPEIVLQAYLHRTAEDIERVLKSNGRLRLCKGAYKETIKVAYQDKEEIRKKYINYIEKLLLQGQRVCIATHDDIIIDHCMRFIKENNIPLDRYEFQMLFGMRKKTWEKIRNQGHNMTIYVPYGEDWKLYYARRLAERKENVFFVLKNLFRS